MKIRLYESWQDENMNRDCCVCDIEPGLFVIDFGNYKTMICEKCVDRFIDKLQKCKKTKICGHCKYRKPSVLGYKCSCGKSNVFNCYVNYGVKGCGYFESKGEDK